MAKSRPPRIRIEGDKALLAKLDKLSDAAKGKTLERGLTAGALIIQNAAKVKAPYQTGNLRRSIHIGGHEDLNPDKGDIVDQTGEAVPRPELGANTVAVYTGTDVSYAGPAEYGARGRRAHPYLRPAADENKGAVAKEVGEALRDLVNAAVR